jgi:acetyl esterase/lipase
MIFWLCVALVFGAFSLLAVFRAPSLPLVFLAVGATELGHFFGAAAVGLAVFAPVPAAIILLGAAGLLFSPLVRAIVSVRGVRDAFERGLGLPLRRPLLNLSALWWPRIAHRGHGRRVEAGAAAFDFYPARGVEAAPVVVVIHGGGWMAGDCAELAGWNRWLNARGCAVAAVDYRLVPTGAWPAQREDVLATVAHLRGHAEEFGIDPERMVFLGRSAGGQIASAISATGDHSWLRGCICVYAPFDLDFAYAHGDDEDMLRSRWLLRSYLGGTPEQRAEAYHEASACQCVRPGAPPFLLLHGGRDELVWVAQSVRFAQRLGTLGVPHALVELPWAAHAFDYNMSGPGGQITAACVEGFLRRVLRG